MRGLRKYLTPFAPDQSGAVSMCYALGGMVVIVDAGGCAGNICGFDEPRWQADYGAAQGGGGTPHVEAVFSAGLRDMDAILGRDDHLVQKLKDAAGKIHAKFIALVGTPVPAVIGTDLESVARMAQKATSLPCIAISTDGMHLYDRGMEEALLVLVRRFCVQNYNADSGDNTHAAAKAQDSAGADGNDGAGAAVKKDGRRICGVLGLNPLDLFDPAWTQDIRSALMEKGYEEVLLHCMEGGLDTLKRSALAERNYVVSPSGIAAAEYLKQAFGTPYEVTYPADPMHLTEEDALPPALSLGSCGRILVIHQQVLANAIRRALRTRGAACRITCATWFDLKESLAEKGDLHLKEEDDLTDVICGGKWDMIIADPALRPMAGDWDGIWIDAFHFAVSGQAAIENSFHRR